MNQEAYKELEEKIGVQGAKLAVVSRRSYIALGIISLVGYAGIWALRLPQMVLNLWFLLVVIAAGVFVGSKVKLARALSIYFKTKIHWYEIPQINQQRMLDKWLEKVKTRATD